LKDENNHAHIIVRKKTITSNLPTGR